MAFRDEQLALRARLQAAERELALVEQEKHADQGMREELSAMLEVLAEAETENQRERIALTSLKARIGAMERALGLAPSEPPGKSNKTLVLGAGALIASALIVMALLKTPSENAIPVEKAGISRPETESPVLPRRSTPGDLDGLMDKALLPAVTRDPAETKRIHGAYRGDIRHCYETTSSGSPLEGTVSLYVSISVQGRVEAALARTPPGASDLGDCLEAATSNWSFAPHAGPDPKMLLVPIESPYSQ